MSKEKYTALMEQMNRQKIAIDQEKVVEELIINFHHIHCFIFRRLWES